jgi:hypothetical protein
MDSSFVEYVSSISVDQLIILVDLYLVYFNSILSLIQFDDMGEHGTKIIVYNLWFNDDGDMELDFNSDTKVCNAGLLWSYILLMSRYLVHLLYRLT